METIDIKRIADKLIIHVYILISKHTFLAYYVSLLLVMVFIINRVPSLLCFHVIIMICIWSQYPVVLHSPIN